MAVGTGAGMLETSARVKEGRVGVILCMLVEVIVLTWPDEVVVNFFVRVNV